MKKKRAAKRNTASAKPKQGGSGIRAPLVPYDQLNEIVDFLEKRGLEEFEFERDGLRIRVKRQGSAPVVHAVPADQSPPSAPAAPATEEPSAADLGEGVHQVKSPIVGTFYEAARPGAPPFVKVGDHVRVGQPLCIVEAMKLMNEIESDADGEIIRIFGTNAQPVEYGEPLFAIRLK